MSPHSLGSFVVKSYLDPTKVTPDSKNREFKPPIKLLNSQKWYNMFKKLSDNFDYLFLKNPVIWKVSDIKLPDKNPFFLW